jgi:arylsulfatase A-like enzyme
VSYELPVDDEMTNDDERSGGWLDRHPAVVSVLAAAGIFGLFQGLFMAWRNQEIGGLEAAVGMGRIGLIVGPVTVLVLVPVVLLARRRHPAWRRGDRHRATWSVCFALTAAVAAWMVADQWVAGPMVPPALEPWLEGAAAIAAGLAAAWVQPPKRFLRLMALATPFLVVLALLPIGPAQGDTGRDTTAKPVSAPPPGDDTRPDVVLVCIDTLRADRLGAYERSPSITPEMDRIASEGVVFRRALAAAPWTVPSVASMLTGLPAVRHGAGMPLGSGLTFLRSPLDAEHTTLAERFAAAGYRTAAVVANGFLGPQMGMTQGFEEFDNPIYRVGCSIIMRDMPLFRLGLTLFPAERWGDYRAQGITDAALEWLASSDGKGDADDGDDDERPVFLWVHYIDPHTPFQADPAALDLAAMTAEIRQTLPETRDDGTVVGEVFAGTSHVRGGMLWLGPEDRRRIEEYYDRAVAYVDEHVGRLFEALRERGTQRPVVAALTSDHGEEFWDHGHFEHGHDYYREVTRIPLVFWSPGLLPAGREVDGLAGLVDVGATLLELAGVESPPPAAADEGRSLTALWQGGGEDGSELPQPATRFAGGNLYDLPAVLLEDGSWRFILRANGMAELYDVTRDPEEHFNLTHDHPQLVERYRQVLEPRLAAFIEGGTGDKPQELSPETIKALRSLGYVQ